MPPESIIRSRQNPVYKQLRSLLRRDRRHQERAFLVEGPRFIDDARRFGADPQLVVLSESTATSINTAPPELLATSRVLDDELFGSISDTVTSQGVIAVFPFPDVPDSSASIPFVLVADGVQDPGNLGTLIRSAAGAGVTKVIVLPGTADPYSPKTVRAAAGAHFLVAIETTTFADFPAALPDDAMILGASACGSVSYESVDLTGPVVMVVGAEGRGLSDQSEALIEQLVSIPLDRDVESLNAGVAGSILLFEASRQRRLNAKPGKNPSI